MATLQRIHFYTYQDLAESAKTVWQLTSVKRWRCNRADQEGQHGAKVDSLQTAGVVERLRNLAEQNGDCENRNLEDCLQLRIEPAKKGEFSDNTVDDVFDEAILDQTTQDETNK